MTANYIALLNLYIGTLYTAGLSTNVQGAYIICAIIHKFELHVLLVIVYLGMM